MPDRTQDLKNHRQVAVACKNYTDTEIKKSEERILSIVARNNVSYIDHTDEATYRFTAPANAKLLMLQSIAGNSVKYSPSVASDNTVAYIKTLPSTVYDLDVSKVEGVGYKVNQLIPTKTVSQTGNGISITSNNDGTYTIVVENATNWLQVTLTNIGNFVTGRKYLIIGNRKTSSTNCIEVYISGNTAPNNTNDYITTNVNDINNAFLYVGKDTPNGTYVVKPQIFDLTADFGSDNEPSTVSDCATEYAKRGVDIYEYTPQQSSIKNNAFTGATIEGSNLRYLPNTTLSQQGTIIPRYLVNLPKGTYYISFDWTGGGSMAIICENSSQQTINILTLDNLTSGRNGGTFTITQEAVYIRGYSNNPSGGTISNIMLNNGSTAMSYVPYIQPTTISVDLTTIKDSNNNPLFPSGKMMGNSSVADFITPYNQESRWFEYTFTGNETWGNRGSGTGGDLYYLTLTSIAYAKTDFASAVLVSNGYYLNSGAYDGNISGTIGLDNRTIYVCVPSGANPNTIFANGVVMQYERATYLTSNTDLTSLTGIQGQSLGTIILNNTGNVDMPNLISYNAIIKHALATAVKQDGFNLFNKNGTFIEAYCDGSGKLMSNSDMKSYVIEVSPSQTYYFYTNNKNGGMQRMAFTKTYPQIGDYIYSNETSTSFLTYANGTTTTIPNGFNYMIVTFFRTSTATNTLDEVINNLCINISNQALNGTYKSYKAPITRLLPNSEAKYSWGITDGVRNTRVFCDDEGNAVNEGSLVVGNNDLGLQTWGKTSVFYTTLNDMKSLAQTICNNFETYIMGETLPNYDCIQIRNNHDIYFRYQNDSPYASLEANVFKSSMNGVMLEFEKATTDTETLDDFDFSFDCEEGDTFTLVNTEQLQCYATYSFLIKEAKSNE